MAKKKGDFERPFYFREGETTKVFYKMYIAKHDKSLSFQAIITSPNDGYLAAGQGGLPKLLPVSKVSKAFLGIRTRNDDLEFLFEERIEAINAALNLNVFTQLDEFYISTLKSPENWQDYQGKLYSKLNMSPIQLFYLQLFGSFFLPALLKVKKEQKATLKNTILEIDYNGPILKNGSSFFYCSLPSLQATKYRSSRQ